MKPQHAYQALDSALAEAREAIRQRHAALEPFLQAAQHLERIGSALDHVGAKLGNCYQWLQGSIEGERELFTMLQSLVRTGDPLGPVLWQLVCPKQPLPSDGQAGQAVPTVPGPNGEGIVQIHGDPDVQGPNDPF